ncbi:MULTISPECIES: hypothetical protein [Streptomyces]|uniref:Uncharacterized protein n=2 Tax=Streptomyces TaxID=1883 RepID=A0A1E7M156_9ACTN|nr:MULTISPECIES: hypothetical protein [Streptomyces]OEV22116.1 hypothetical protein AN221_04190 [Streptomyces nanshensis]RDV51705.1 hypothetical protein DDV98_11890 [Streptomyces sp. IB2014 011-12]
MTESAGITAIRAGGGWVALVGPGLTEDVDETALTANALWTAVTGKRGDGCVETVHVMDRSETAEKRRMAESDAAYADQRERSVQSKRDPATPAQLKYLHALVAQAGRERFGAGFNKAMGGTGVAPRGAEEKTQAALGRLTKAKARKLITALVAAPEAASTWVRVAGPEGGST